MLILFDFLALMWSSDSLATRLLAFWYMEIAFLVIRVVLLDLKKTLGDHKSLGIKPSGSNKSMESDMMDVLKLNQRNE